MTKRSKHIGSSLDAINKTQPLGWYVRVKIGEITDGVYDSVLYIAGYPDPGEAEAAVKAVHANAKGYEVLKGGIVPGTGPQRRPGEVRSLKGAV